MAKIYSKKCSSLELYACWPQFPYADLFLSPHSPSRHHAVLNSNASPHLLKSSFPRHSVVEVVLTTCNSDFPTLDTSGDWWRLIPVLNGTFYSYEPVRDNYKWTHAGGFFTLCDASTLLSTSNRRQICVKRRWCLDWKVNVHLLLLQ